MFALLVTFVLILSHKTNIKLVLFFTLTFSSDNIMCQYFLYGSDREIPPGSQKIAYSPRQGTFPSTIIPDWLNNSIHVITQHKLNPIPTNILSRFFCDSLSMNVAPMSTFKVSIWMDLNCFVFFTDIL